MTDLDGEAHLALATLRERFGELRPTVGLILGSGLGSFAEKLEGARKLPFDRIPGFAASTIVGHAGNLVYGRVGTLEVFGHAGSTSTSMKDTTCRAWPFWRACWSPRGAAP